MTEKRSSIIAVEKVRSNLNKIVGLAVYDAVYAAALDASTKEIKKAVKDALNDAIREADEVVESAVAGAKFHRSVTFGDQLYTYLRKKGKS